MATATGQAGVVKVGGSTLGEVKNFTLNMTADTVEDTALTDSNKSYKALRGDATATVEVHYDRTDSGQEALIPGNSVTLEGADSSDKYFSGTAIITGEDASVSMDDIIARTFTVQFSGGVSRLTV
jgi:sporulation protein YlmC with PRC-barrel domain